MKNLKLFKTIGEYREYIYREVVTREEFKNHPFYKGLIEFVIDQRTPLFFEASEEVEYAHFTQYFNFVLRREYDNHYLSDLYYLHDFVHMIFENPHRPSEMSARYFRDMVVSNERVAANDTEIMTYFRLPKLRTKTHKFPILYDFLKIGGKPNVEEAFCLRNRLIESDYLPRFLDNEQGKAIVAFLKRFKSNNKRWCRLWRRYFPKDVGERVYRPMILGRGNYEQVLERYVPLNSQKQYEENILFNVRLGLKMLKVRRQPKDFRDCFNFIKYFEDQILMREAAEKYHKLYLRSKTKANEKSRVAREQFSFENLKSGGVVMGR